MEQHFGKKMFRESVEVFRRDGETAREGITIESMRRGKIYEPGSLGVRYKESEAVQKATVALLVTNLYRVAKEWRPSHSAENEAKIFYTYVDVYSRALYKRLGLEKSISELIHDDGTPADPRDKRKPGVWRIISFSIHELERIVKHPDKYHGNALGESFFSGENVKVLVDLYARQAELDIQYRRDHPDGPIDLQ